MSLAKRAIWSQKVVSIFSVLCPGSWFGFPTEGGHATKSHIFASKRSVHQNLTRSLSLFSHYEKKNQCASSMRVMARQLKTIFHCASLVFNQSLCFSSPISTKILFQLIPRDSFNRIIGYGHKIFDCQGIPSFALVFNVFQKANTACKKKKGLELVCKSIHFVNLKLFTVCQ